MQKIATQINLLGQFCGRRDLTELSQAALRQQYGYNQADVFVLFGGSILAGVTTLATAIRQHVAKYYVIVGGYGHTTAALFQQAQKLYPEINFTANNEAALFAQLLKQRDHLTVDYLETASTNCGNNVTNLLALLATKKITYKSLILCQDATMQLRMTATMRQHVAPDVELINYAAYQVTVCADHNTLTYAQTPTGMWSVTKYTTLLLGEISRLADTATGYGPAGKNYLVHVTVPPKVITAAQALQTNFDTRQANPRFSGA
ncbi:ElyC/SanA/YdcF family protein [Loigolactobacillus jiayinensis]|uniref:ElyC/SanA/YdcF family protein n=1 Tax=Loigolactobacillus jiayinensis TaxID=2486016 RepID=A0ABW1RJX7_9LACO|nr:ElyC/SanA/YdcF family protein [Loigolactobacillus jiayinensis]